MHLLRASEIDFTSMAAVFRYSRFRAALTGLVVLAIGTLCLLVGRRQFVGWERYVICYIGAMPLLALFFLRGYVTARFRDSNWLAQTNPTGVFLKFRSYLNYAMPDSDETVVFIPYEEIRSAGLLTERVATTDPRGGRTTLTNRYVEFDVAGDVSELANAISAERARPAPAEKHWYGTSSTLYNDFPVRVVSPSFVQVQWAAVPGRKQFLRVLSPPVQIAPPVKLTEDLTKLASLTREQQSQRLRELDAAGQTVLAIATARRLYGYDLSGAKDFIENLRDASAPDRRH